jgi:hypothetical protein
MSTQFRAFSTRTGFGLGGFANWRMLIGASWHIRQLGRGHRALALVKMPATQIQADDVAKRIIAIIGLIARRNACFGAGPVAIASVENLILKDDNRFAQSIRFDIVYQMVEFRTRDEREDLRQRVISIGCSDSARSAPRRSCSVPRCRSSPPKPSALTCFQAMSNARPLR